MVCRIHNKKSDEEYSPQEVPTSYATTHNGNVASDCKSLLEHLEFSYMRRSTWWKHVRIQCPRNSGSLYHNYKDFFSIVLFAIVDADYKFVAVDIGSYGKEGDAAIFKKSEIGKRIENGTLNIPSAAPIPGTNTIIPHVFIGDQAFALKPNLMTPFSQKK